MDIGYKRLVTWVEICIHKHSPWLFSAGHDNKPLHYTLVDNVRVVFKGIKSSEKEKIRSILNMNKEDKILVNKDVYNDWAGVKECGFVFTWEPLYMHIEHMCPNGFCCYFTDDNKQYSCKTFDWRDGKRVDELLPPGSMCIPWLHCQN
jgi:hypothetical protein